MYLHTQMPTCRHDDTKTKKSQLQHVSEKNTHALNETCSMTLFCFDLVFFVALCTVY